MVRKKLTEYNFPKDLKDMTENELSLLSCEIREFLISSIARTGGHLASNLGIVELTIALHKVFNLPGDKVVWDVGHQSYVHKILTGRAGGFHTLRKRGGLSGFPKQAESPSDIYNSGHSSTSISAAMGLASARDIMGEKHEVVAVIGDGAMTGGLAYEGLNNAGTKKTHMIVILNDNEMSISENIGSISLHLGKLRASQAYQDIKKSLKKKIVAIPAVGETLYRGLDHMKDMMRYAVIAESIFEDLGFSYYGPVDGNNIREMIEILERAKTIEGPVLIHAVTVKGKGYRNAEMNPGKFHGIAPFEPETGKVLVKKEETSCSVRCGEKLLDLAAADKRVVAITAAMKEGVGLTRFAEIFENRFYDTGIAEAHAVTFAAGLAIGGMRPFVCIYSTFLQRAYDQIAMDVAMQKLPVVFMIDRAGNVGADGETHHGVFDLSYLAHIPGMTILAPADGTELQAMMDYALQAEKPVAIRFPKGDRSLTGAAPVPLVEGKSRLLRAGGDLQIWAVGNMTIPALAAAECLEKKGISAAVIDARFVKPFDTEALQVAGAQGVPILTLEDNVITGGFGQRVSVFLAHAGYRNRTLNLGWPDQFIEHGDIEQLFSCYGLSSEAIAAQAEALCKKSDSI